MLTTGNRTAFDEEFLIYCYCTHDCGGITASTISATRLLIPLCYMGDKAYEVNLF